MADKEKKPFGLEYLEEMSPLEEFGGLMCPTSYTWPTGAEQCPDHGEDVVNHDAAEL